MPKKKRPGKDFEKDFIASVPDRCDVTRLKDAGGWSNATNMRFTSKNPCDFIVWSPIRYACLGKMYKIELKSVAGKSMPFTNIKPNQFKGLLESDKKGVQSCIIVNFRGDNETCIIDIRMMIDHIATCGRKSLSLENAKRIGGTINQTLKRVRWRYDLEWL